MKRIPILIILVLLAFSVVVVPTVFAQDNQPPPTPETPPPGSPSFWDIDFNSYHDGTLYQFIIDAFVEVLDLNFEEIDWLMDKNLNLFTIALLFGYTGDDLADLMDDVIDEAIDLIADAYGLSDGMVDILKDRVNDLEYRISVFDWAGLAPDEVLDMLDSGMSLCEIAYEQDLPFDRFFMRVCLYSVEEYQAAWEELYFQRQDLRDALVTEYESRWGVWEENFLKYYNLLQNIEINIGGE